MNRYVVSCVLVFAIVAAAAAQTTVSNAVKTTTQANNDFACDIYRQIGDKDAGKNVFFSPWSISSALAMTMEGARNETAIEMGQTLRLPKSLDVGGERPWRMDLYHQGVAEMQRRCTPPRDEAKELATRKKIAELRKELDALNKRIEKNQEFNLFDKAQKLATNINILEQSLDLYELNIANAIWGEKTYPFDPTYADAVSKYYGPGLVRDADFINQFPAERAKINRWVEGQTKDRIKDLIPNIPEQQAQLIRMILVNAIYFKGQWSDPFKKEQTKDDVFTLTDGTRTKAPLMQNVQRARYAAFYNDGTFFETPRMIRFDQKIATYPNEGFLVAEIPYKDNRLAMTVLLPMRADGLPALEKKLTGDALAKWLSKLESRDVNVKLPKFKMTPDYELGPLLKALGMKRAFEPRIADLTGMSKSLNPNDRLHISRVIHKAFVDVNEEGTEAAAATAVIVAVPGSIPTAHPFTPNFFADRPFVFLIREVESGAVLFMGRMTTPK